MTPDLSSVKRALIASLNIVDPTKTQNLADYERFYQTTLVMVRNVYERAGVTLDPETLAVETVKVFREVLSLSPITDVEITKAIRGNDQKFEYNS